MNKAIGWWLSKSKEDRRIFLSDPKTSDTVRENIQQIEKYCLDHPYEVYCGVFYSEDGSVIQEDPIGVFLPQELSVPTPADGNENEHPLLPAPLLASPHPSPDSALNVVGFRKRKRSVGVDETQRTCVEQANAHVQGVVDRLQKFLEQYLGATSEESDCEKKSGLLAKVMVEVLCEACRAAVIRSHAVERFEKDTDALRKPEKLTLRRKVGTTEGAHESEPNDTMLYFDSDDENKNSNTSPFPLAHYRRQCRLQRQLWQMLSLNEVTTTPTKEEKDEEQSISIGSDTPWESIRSYFMKALSQKDSTEMEEEQAEKEYMIPKIQITANDIHFAMRKVMNSDLLKNTLAAS